MSITDSLQVHYYRTVLCDLLTGRVMRGYAQESLDKAIALDEKLRMYGSYRIVEEYLDNAVHTEWMAELAEQGKMAWGGRFNRCGYQPIADDDDIVTEVKGL